MTIDSPTLDQVVSDVCQAMLGLPLESAAAASAANNALMATICIHGDWESRVQITASEDLARFIGQTMFAAEPEDLSEEEILDALGEIVNMIGGNLKGIVPGESNLSLPCVGSLESVSEQFDSACGIVESNFLCESEPLMVRLVELEPANCG